MNNYLVAVIAESCEDFACLKFCETKVSAWRMARQLALEEIDSLGEFKITGPRGEGYLQMKDEEGWSDFPPDFVDYEESDTSITIEGDERVKIIIHKLSE